MSHLIDLDVAFYMHLRTFAQNFSNIDFSPKLLPLKDDEFRNVKKLGGHGLRFGENMSGRTPKSE